MYCLRSHKEKKWLTKHATHATQTNEAVTLNESFLEKSLCLKPLEIGIKSAGIFNLLYKCLKKSVDW